MIILAGICTGDNIWLPIKSAITIICPQLQYSKPIVFLTIVPLPFSNELWYHHTNESMMPTYATFIAVIIEAIHNAIYVII